MLERTKTLRSRLDSGLIRDRKFVVDVFVAVSGGTWSCLCVGELF